MKLTAGNISLNKKLFGFVGVASLLVLAAVGVGAFYYSNIERADLLKEAVNRIVEKALVTRVAEKTYLQFFTPELKTQFDKMAQDVTKEIGSVQQTSTDEAWKKQIAGIGTESERYQKQFEELVEVHGRQNLLKEEMLKPLRTSEELLGGILGEIEQKQSSLQMEGETLSAQEFGMLNIIKDCRTAFIRLQNLQLQFLLSGDVKYMEEYKKLSSGNVQAYITALEQFASAMHNDSFVKSAATVRESLTKFLGSIEQSQKLYENEAEKLKALNNSGREIVEKANALLTQASESIASQKASALKLIVGIVVLALLFFWFLSVGIVRSITRPIRHVIDGLSEAAEQVDAASGQVSTASQELADGASQQAAAIEQTSSSLEQMYSMTRLNAENATHANQLMAEAKRVITQANGSMEQLTSSMGEISKASERTQKIVKTIDEIAFQTNLLALNAAVEAARAGEAGAGFAVVADEVRNLATRAAEAARNTATMIEETVKTIKEGADIVEKTNGEFSQVSVSASKVGELVGGIAAASQEQATGIEQINRAVAEVDKVIQRNSASAEESSSASMEMTARAGHMKGYVGQLASLVGGGGAAMGAAGEDFTPGGRARSQGALQSGISAALPGGFKKSGATKGGNEMQTHQGKPKEIGPEQLIPMDLKEFDEF